MSKEAMKPVAWTDEDFTQLIVSEDIAKDIGATVPLYASPPKREPEPEPDGLSWLKKDSNYFSQPKREPEPVECHTCKGLGRIYMGCGSWIHCDTCNTTGKATTQPKRKPLTDEQMEQIHQQYGGNIKKIMRAVEAAHGIKGEQHGTR